jgi:hypothetical protein
MQWRSQIFPAHLSEHIPLGTSSFDEVRFDGLNKCRVLG